MAKKFQSAGGYAFAKKFGKKRYSQMAKDYWNSPAGLERRKKMSSKA